MRTSLQGKHKIQQYVLFSKNEKILRGNMKNASLSSLHLYLTAKKVLYKRSLMLLLWEQEQNLFTWSLFLGDQHQRNHLHLIQKALRLLLSLVTAGTEYFQFHTSHLDPKLKLLNTWPWLYSTTCLRTHLCGKARGQLGEHVPREGKRQSSLCLNVIYLFIFSDLRSLVSSVVRNMNDCSAAEFHLTQQDTSRRGRLHIMLLAGLSALYKCWRSKRE